MMNNFSKELQFSPSFKDPRVGFIVSLLILPETIDEINICQKENLKRLDIEKINNGFVFLSEFVIKGKKLIRNWEIRCPITGLLGIPYSVKKISMLRKYKEVYIKYKIY